MRLEAIKKQGKRNDLTCATGLHKLENNPKSRDFIAENAQVSHETVRKYIRLTNLIPELLDMVDNSVLKEKGKYQMALRPAVEISYLKTEKRTVTISVTDESGNVTEKTEEKEVTVLTIRITSWSVREMAVEYGFDPEQEELLKELLDGSNDPMWAG